jgi:hypothetical protein
MDLPMERRDFLKKSVVGAAAVGLVATDVLAQKPQLDRTELHELARKRTIGGPHTLVINYPKKEDVCSIDEFAHIDKEVFEEVVAGFTKKEYYSHLFPSLGKFKSYSIGQDYPLMEVAQICDSPADFSRPSFRPILFPLEITLTIDYEHGAEEWKAFNASNEWIDSFKKEDYLDNPELLFMDCAEPDPMDANLGGDLNINGLKFKLSSVIKDSN